MPIWEGTEAVLGHAVGLHHPSMPGAPISSQRSCPNNLDLSRDENGAEL